MLRRLARCTLACLALGATARADVLVVSVDGPFFAPQAAIDAAVDGDTVLVEGPFTFGGFTIDGKALTVVAEGGPVDLVGAIVVSNTAANQPVLVQGFSSQGYAAPPPDPLDQTNVLGLLVHHTVGPVRFADCNFVGAHSSGGIDYNGSSAVPEGDPQGHPGAWLGFTNADVSFVRCSFTGGNAASVVTPPPFCGCTFGDRGGHGLLAANSTVSLWDCTLQGGNGGSADVVAGDGGDGYHGILGQLFTSGSTFFGGVGGNGEDFVVSEGGDGGAGLRTSSTTMAWLRDSDAVGGTGGWAIAGPAGTDGPGHALGGSTFAFSAPAASLAIDSPVREGVAADLTIDGQPGDLVFVLVSLTDGSLFVPGFSGWLGAGPPWLIFEFVGAVPGSGQIAGQTTFPDLGPGVDVVSLRLQALHSPDLVTAAFSNWTPLVVLDAGL